MVITAPRATDCLNAVGALAARFRVGDDVFPKPLQAPVLEFTVLAFTRELPSQPGRSRPGTVLFCLLRLMRARWAPREVFEMLALTGRAAPKSESPPN